MKHWLYAEIVADILIQPTISLEMPVSSQGHYDFHSFPVVDWFCLFIWLWVKIIYIKIGVNMKHWLYAEIVADILCSIVGTRSVTLVINAVILYTYEFWLYLCKIVRKSVILLLPLFHIWPRICSVCNGQNRVSLYIFTIWK
jgi:hypothetical protein